MRFHHSVQNDTKYKTYELCIFGIFHLKFLDHGLPWITETKESKTMDKKGTYLAFINIRGKMALRNKIRDKEISTSNGKINEPET